MWRYAKVETTFKFSRQMLEPELILPGYQQSLYSGLLHAYSDIHPKVLAAGAGVGDGIVVDGGIPPPPLEDIPLDISRTEDMMERLTQGLTAAELQQRLHLGGWC